MSENNSESSEVNEKKFGRPRRYAAEYPGLPFKDYEKLWRKRYISIKNELREQQYGPRKKIGRPLKYHPEELGIATNDDGSFSCTFCNHCFRCKPERHVMGVYCTRARIGSQRAKELSESTL